MNLDTAIQHLKTHTDIKIVTRKGNLLKTSVGMLFFYEAEYKFRELNETNIPLNIYKKIPRLSKQILLSFEDNLYLVNKLNIPKKPRIIKSKSLAIYPIPSNLLISIPRKEQALKSKFIHLHLHSDYSLLDGITNCKSYLERAKELGMDAIAVTDHGNVSAHMDLQLRAKELGIKPIFGSEFYIVQDATLHDGDHRSSSHIVLLAKDDVGYRNLLTLQKLSWSPENYYYRPRIDYKMLSRHHKGLIVTTACLKGLLGLEVLHKRLRTAYKKAKWLKKLFGDDLYLEIQMHNIFEGGIDIQKFYNMQLIKMSKKLDIELVLTNDTHYVGKGMHKVQEKVIKIKIDSDLSEAYCESIWLKSYNELRRTRKMECPYITSKDFESAVRNTIRIADKCSYSIPTGGLRIPKIDIKEFPGYRRSQSEEDYLRKRVSKGLVYRHKRLSADLGTYLDRIEYEIDAFVQMNVISYILIYDDLIRYLKKKGCLCSLRGSANGSVVLWLIGMSIVDPIKFDILFERFISPARIEAKMADIDIDLDIAHTYRDTAIDYLKDKYGEDHICSVGSFNRTQLKGAIKSIARVEAFALKKKIETAKTEAKKLKLEKKLKPFLFQEINKITKVMPDDPDEISKSSVAGWFEENEKWYNAYVKPILGNAYADSLHPAGVVVSPEPYHHWLPVRTNKLPKDKGGHRVFASQWENSHTFEEFLNERGVMVMDILGVKTLTIISDALKLIRKKHKEHLTLETIPLDNKKVYRTLSKGENLGVFQLNKGFIKGILRQVMPDNIEDIIFMVSADRPGPMASNAFERYSNRKHGIDKVKYPHKSLENALKDSLGVLVYSEHVMRTATEFAGMDAVDSESMRQIIKAKDPSDFKKFKEKFISSAIKKHGEKVITKAEKIWDEIMGFAGYAFPKAHATAYAIISNATQYLKVKYPIEFFCSHLQQAEDKDYLRIKNVSKKFYKVKYLMPEINLSKEGFTIHKDKIVWSLTSIKGIGGKVAVEIAKEQPFASFETFFLCVNKRVVNVRVVKALIAANVFRKFGNRNKVSKMYAKLRKDKEWEKKSKEQWDYEASQIVPYFKQSVRETFSDKMGAVLTYDEFLAKSMNKRVVIAGTIESYREIQSKRGRMILMRVGDMGDTFYVVCWNDMFKRLQKKDIRLGKDMPVKISGFKSLSNMGEEQIALGNERESYIKVLK